MSNQQHWPKHSPKFSQEQLESLLRASVQAEVSRISVEDIIKNTNSFPVKFPINTVKCEYIRTQDVPEDILERNINSVYPIIHETALPLFLEFLSHKKQFGSKVEKQLYENFTVPELIDRLLAKRAVMFCGRFDAHMLLDGVEAIGNWETIGTDAESPPKTLENCLSYDEIKLSALLSVSSYTHFINDGARANRGKYCENRETLEDFGVIIGLIGPRLNNPEVMEYQEIMVTKEQNVKDKGYGKSSTTLKSIFLNFYNEPNLTYKQLKPKLADTNKYIAFKEKKTYFNIDAYQRRLSLSIDTLLLEANERGRETGKMSYVFLVGIGLGDWRICSAQNQLFMDACCKRIEFLGPMLKHVSDIYFSYIEVDSCGKYVDGDLIPIPDHPNGGIKIHIGRRNPHTKLIGEHQGKLLVVSYAGDGNSLPGNVFWCGSLHTGSDPAAVCSTQVAELHNRYINPKVSVAGLRIATLIGVETFRAYVEKLQVSA